MSYNSLLNTTCTIQVATKAVNATTGEVTKSWATHATLVPCRLDQARGAEIRKADNVYIKATHMLFILYRTDLNEKDYRIVIGSNTYNILLVRQAGGMTNHTELDLEIIS